MSDVYRSTEYSNTQECRTGKQQKTQFLFIHQRPLRYFHTGKFACEVGTDYMTISTCTHIDTTLNFSMYHDKATSIIPGSTNLLFVGK